MSPGAPDFRQREYQSFARNRGAMKPTKRDVASQFDRMSHAYASSEDHARGDDLAILLDYLAPQHTMRVLDVATGAGHTAVAVARHVREVVAIDIAPAMLARTRELAVSAGLDNVRTLQMDVESLEFDAGSFDAVTCRIAPHHFLDIDGAITQIARVLAPGGAFVVEDSVAPDDAQLGEYLNDVERIRDATHVRSLTLAEWRSKLAAADLHISRSTIYRKSHDFAAWVERAGADDAGRERVYDAFAQASPAAVERFAIEYGEGRRAVRFTDDKVILRAARP